MISIISRNAKFILPALLLIMLFYFIWDYSSTKKEVSILITTNINLEERIKEKESQLKNLIASSEVTEVTLSNFCKEQTEILASLNKKQNNVFSKYLNRERVENAEDSNEIDSFNDIDIIINGMSEVYRKASSDITP